MSRSREQLIKWLNTIDITGDKVLDVGCGPKDKWARNFTKGEPEYYDTLDIDETFSPDFEIDMNIPNYCSEGYTKIFFIETAEHLWNPVQALKNIHQMLQVGGELYFAAPFIQCVHDKWDMLRLTKQWWETVLPMEGFKVDYVKARVATIGKKHLDNFYKSEGIRISKVTLKQGRGNEYYDIGYMGKAVKWA